MHLEELHSLGCFSYSMPVKRILYLGHFKINLLPHTHIVRLFFGKLQNPQPRNNLAICIHRILAKLLIVGLITICTCGSEKEDRYIRTHKTIIVRINTRVEF